MKKLFLLFILLWFFKPNSFPKGVYTFPPEINGGYIYINMDDYTELDIILMNKGLVIKNNATVVIHGTGGNVWMRIVNGNDIFIKIECGSKLILDNAKIDLPGGMACPHDLWGGIIVEGNSSINQNIHNQGFLTIENNTIIRKAWCAVKVCGGGMVQAGNCTIEDCDTSVAFDPYQHSTNFSNFNHCNFQLSSLTDCSGPFAFDEFVTLNNVQGIGFYGCKFYINDNTGHDFSYQGIGIDAINSSFLVQRAVNPNSPQIILQPGDCIPSPTGDKNIFYRLKTGIKIQNSFNLSREVSINENQFLDNITAIYCIDDYNTSIYDNNFDYDYNVPYDPNLSIYNFLQSYAVYSIITDASNSFKIQQNTFDWNILTKTHRFYGIGIIEPINTNICRVKNNTFINYSNSNTWSYGIFVSTQFPIPDKTPANIKFICNTYTNLSSAIDINDLNNLNIVSQWDPFNYNYPPYKEPGNTFNNVNYAFEKINGSPKIQYYLFSGASLSKTPNCYPSRQLNIITTSLVNQCPNITNCEIYGKVGNNSSLSLAPATDLQCINNNLLIRGTPTTESMEFIDTFLVQEQDTSYSIYIDSIISINVIGEDTIYSNVLRNNQENKIIDPLLSDINVTNVNCFGGKNGAIEVFVLGGVPPYTYTWSNDDTTDNISELSAGAYILNITDSINSVIIDTVIVNQPTALTVSGSVTDINCNNINFGSVDLSINGGSQPYHIAWSNGDTTQNISGLIGGTYIATVTDSDNCIEYDTAIIHNKLKLSAEITADNSVPTKLKVYMNNAFDSAYSYHYHWYPTNDTTNIIYIEQSITFSVHVSGKPENTCPDSASIFIPGYPMKMSGSVNNIVNDFQLYPNPVKDIQYITISNNDNSKTLYAISLFDKLGQNILNKAIILNPGEQSTRYLDLKQFSSGLYLLTLFRNGIEINKYKVIKL